MAENNRIKRFQIKEEEIKDVKIPEEKKREIERLNKSAKEFHEKASDK